MALPEFNEFGELPAGIYPATLGEVLARFGTGSVRRSDVTARLRRIYELARLTGMLERLIVFGSYVTDKESPNDVDIVLVMRDGFRLSQCPPEALPLFFHDRAADEIGASVFWVRPAMLIGGETPDQFLGKWQITRDGRFRGIVEVR